MARAARRPALEAHGTMEHGRPNSAGGGRGAAPRGGFRLLALVTVLLGGVAAARGDAVGPRSGPRDLVDAALAEARRGVTPMPGSEDAARLGEFLGLAPDAVPVIAALLDEVARERSERVAALLAGPDAAAVHEVIDAGHGRPGDHELIPVAPRIAAVGCELRAIDEDAHLRLAERLGEQVLRSGAPPGTAQLWLRRLRHLDQPGAGAARGRTASAASLTAGVDLLRLTAEPPTALARAMEPGTARATDSARRLLAAFAAAAGGAAPAADAGPSGAAGSALGLEYARRLDVALREVERLEEGMCRAALEAITTGERAPWDDAIARRDAARLDAARIGEDAADRLAALLEEHLGAPGSTAWRHELRALTWPGIVDDGPVRGWWEETAENATDPVVRRALEQVWHDYVAARERVERRLVRSLLDGADLRAAHPAFTADEPSSADRRLREALADAEALERAALARLHAILASAPPGGS